MASRQQKRARLAQNAQHDSIPEDEDYSVVHSREGRTMSRDSAPIPVREPIVDTALWQARSSWNPADDAEYALDPQGGHLYDQVLHADVGADDPPPVLKKTYIKSKVSKRPHVVWKEQHRETYLQEIMRWEGRGDFRNSRSCPDCQARKMDTPADALYRCDECFVPDLVCASCCVRRHRTHPFHRIQMWNTSLLLFESVTLRSLGAYIQLNHSGLVCLSPAVADKRMVILHTNGLHDVCIKYCGCTKAIPHHLQLLRRGLYPASQITIRTCASFELLTLLHTLALTTKSNTYDFYRALERLTDGTGLNPPSSRYRALLRMVLQWRHLKLLKRGGRGNEVSGALGTDVGELAVLCPSCPRPGINLSNDWELAPPALKYLYAIFLCMDANFRLKNQMVSNYSQDPGLGTGWSYLVPRKEYEEYVLKRASDSDISTCVGFQALAKANTKFSKGLRYTGVGMVSCGRSEMVLPAGVGNLQKGERYANMDYIFGSALHLAAVALVLVSYDICCQWFVNLFKRVEEHWPSPIRPNLAQVKMTPAIPKMHEPAHGKADHEKYSLNYIPGVGYSDFEGPERIWSAHNSLGNSTKTQGPGSRQDVLDDHFSFWNWLKYANMGRTLMKRYRAAVAERNVQVEGHRGFTESVDDAETIARWEGICVRWENALYPKSKVKNPYALDGVVLTETQVKHRLRLEDEQFLEDGGEPLHDTSPSEFIILGLDLEESQRRTRRLAKSVSDKSTPKTAADLKEQRGHLRSRIKNWEQLLPIYLPGLLQYQSELPTNVPPSSTRKLTEEEAIVAAINAEHPENAIIWLPSRLPVHARRRVCREGLPKIEERLRDVHLDDSLETIRHILRVKSRMIAFKNKNYRGQREGTRSRTVIDRIHDKALAAAEKYRAAREWKLKLAANSDWERRYLPLANGDIRGYQDPNKVKSYTGRRGTREDDELEAIEVANANERAAAEQEARGDAPADFDMASEDRSRRDGTGETRRTLSWIWTVEGVQGLPSDEPSDDILRVEWCKSRARSNRAVEEVMLLKEEMRRTLAFLKWRSLWWLDKEDEWASNDLPLKEGIRAYARRQSVLQNDLHDSFNTLWTSPLTDTLNTQIPSEHPPISTTLDHTEEAGDDDDDGDDLFDDDDVLDDEREASEDGEESDDEE